MSVGPQSMFRSRVLTPYKNKTKCVCVSDPLDVLDTWHCFVSQLLHCSDGRVTEIRWLSINHLHHHDSQRPDVHLKTGNGQTSKTCF